MPVAAVEVGEASKEASKEAEAVVAGEEGVAAEEVEELIRYLLLFWAMSYAMCLEVASC